MLVSLSMTLLYVLLPLGVTFGAHAPEDALQALVVLMLSAMVFALVAPRIAEVLTRILALAPHAPPARPRIRAVRVFRLAGEPGAPGSVLARAPSFLVRAFA